MWHTRLSLGGEERNPNRAHFRDVQLYSVIVRLVKKLRDQFITVNIQKERGVN